MQIDKFYVITAEALLNGGKYGTIQGFAHSGQLLPNVVVFPCIFLKAALTQMVEIPKSEGISVIDEKALEIINDKRRAEKKK